MKTLDEIEKLSTNYAAACEMTGNLGTTGDELARFVLRALPVLRASGEWRDTVQSGHVGKHDENMNNLIARVDAFRSGDK